MCGMSWSIFGHLSLINAYPDRALEAVLAGSVVVFEARFSQVERHVLDAVVVMLADPGPLHQSPEALDSIGMGQLLDVCERVIDHGVKHFAANLPVNGILIGDQDRSVFFDEAIDEPFQAVRARSVGDLCLDAPAAFQNANNGRFGSSEAAWMVYPILCPVLMTGLAADVSLIGFDDTLEERLLIRIEGHCGPNPMHDRPDRGSVHAQITGNLTGARRLFGIDHQSQDQKPLLERHVRMVKDRPNRHGEGPSALMALPPAHRSILVPVNARFLALAVVARWFSAPPHLLQVLNGIQFCLESVKDFYDVHLERDTR